jgi:GNAT superfamily N-acetyltransferase
VNIEYKKLYSKDIAKYFDELARLRIKIFREFPYLYEGSVEYEREYLQRYIDAKDSLIVLAIVDGKIIGASSCLPLSQEEDDFKKPFNDYDINSIFYFGESIILPEYRGNKVGHEFFKLREDHAQKTIQLKHTTFCAVNRMGHRATPENYRPLDEFWNRLGYEKTDLKVYYPWTDIGENEETKKEMNFWLKKWF